MIEKPKKPGSGLSEKDHQLLISELTKYANEGASDEDLKSFRETFISTKNKSNKGALGVFDDVANVMKQDPSIKKKSTAVSPSGQNQEDVSLATSTTATKKPSVSSGSESKNLFRGDAGAGEQTYRLDKSSGIPVWKEYSSTMVDYSGKKPQYDVYDKSITDPTRVKTLNKFFKQNASASEVEEVFTGFPGKEANRYRVFNGSWQRMQPNAKEWTTINEDNAVAALNRQFKKDIKPIKGLNVTKQGAKFTDINTKLVSQTEGNVVPYLQKKYSNLGFTFEEAGVGQDYVTVTSKDGNTIDVSLDEANPEEALKLRHFLSQNASTPESKKSKYLKIKREEDPNYSKSPEYINALKSLNPDDVEDIVESRKEKLVINLKSQGTSMFSSKEDVEKAKKDLNNFYSSEEYKVYKEKKSEKQKERATKVDQLYYELNNAKTAKDKQYIKSKINTFLSDDIIQKQTDGYNMQMMDVQNAYKKIKSEYTNLNSANASGKLTQEQYDAQLAKLNQKRVDLKENSDGVISQMKKLEKVTGKYLLDKEKTGSFGGNLLNGFVSSLVGMIADIPETIVAENFKDVNYEALSPEEKEYISSKEYNNEQAVNYLSNKNLLKRKEEIKSGAIEFMGDRGTTKEYSQSKDRGFFENALVGVAQSLPSMIIPGGAIARTAAMSSQAYSSIEDEMLNDEDFETTSMAERSLIAAPYAVGMGILENLGFTKMISKDPLAKSLVMKSITKVLTKKGTTETLESALEKELKSNITKFGLKVVGGTLAEAETGALQSAILDVGLKTAYNKIRNSYENKSDEEIAKLTNEGYFNTPDNLKEASAQILEDAAAEALGGTVMTAAMTGFEKLSNGEITLFNDEDITKLKDLSSDPEMKKMFVAKLRTDMVEGKITKEEAKTKLEALRSVEADFTRIPDDITGPDLRRAVKLSIEKKDLTKEIEGKDENLVAPKKARIEEINNELKTIGENATKQADIVQAEEAQTVESVRAEEQAELMEALPNAEQYMTDGKVDRAKITDNNDLKVFDEIYSKYDKIITPLIRENKGVDGKNTDTVDSNISSQEEKVVEETATEPKSSEVKKSFEVHVGGIERGYTESKESEGKSVGDIRTKIDSESGDNGVLITKGGTNGPTENDNFVVAWSKVGSDGKRITEAGSGNRPGWVSASVKVSENASEQEIEDAKVAATAKMNAILPTIKDGKFSLSKVDTSTNVDIEQAQQPVTETTNERKVAFHGGDLSKGINGVLYVSEDENQANEYAKGNEGEVNQVDITDLNIVDEDSVFDVIKENDFKPKDGESSVEELNLFELIDPNFETSLSEDDLSKLSKILSEKGIDAVKFKDTNLKTLKQDISNIAIFNTEKAKLIQEEGPTFDEVKSLDTKDPNIDNEGFTKSEYEDSTDNTTSQDKYSTKVSPTGKSVEVKNNQDGTVKKNQRIITGEDGRRFVYENGDKSKKIYIPSPKKTAIESEVEAIGEFISGTDAEINKKVSRIKNKRIVRSVSRAAKALSKVLPDVKIMVHETQEAYNKAVGEEGNFSNGQFNPKTNTIHINSVNANSRTVAHEVFHAVLLNKVKTDANAQAITKKLVEAIAPKIDKNPALRKYLDNFISQYDSNVQNEEKLAEFVGKLADNYNSFTTPVKDIITRWINKLADMFGLERTNDTYDALKTIAGKIASGKEITDSDIEIIPNGDSEVGEFNITRLSRVKKAPKASDDERQFIRDLVEDIDIREFNGSKFVTNMYDYTNAGITDLGNGFKINLFGGKNYVPYMMSLKNKKIGEVSNLAAFNTKAQAETFIRNAQKSGAKLFAPHSGTLGQSWQFQQHTFAELVNLILDNDIMTNDQLIDSFNKVILGSDAAKNNFKAFSKKYGEQINNFDVFKSDPKKIIELLDIKNNFSPDLRKKLNNSISSNKIFQKAIGINNKQEFYNKIIDPLNNGVKGGEIMNIVKFDPNTFEIIETKADNIDHHPSFGWTLLAKIDGIYQPTEFHYSSDVTNEYTKYNIKKEVVSRKSEEPEFNKKNVSSSAGAIPKVADFENVPKEQLNIESTIKKLKDQGFTDAAIKKYLENQGIKGSQSQEAIRRYNAVKDNVFLNDPKTGLPKIAQSIKKWSKDQLTTKGNKPNSMFEAQENMDGVIAEALNKVVRISKDFNTVYNKIPKEQREKFLEDYDSYLRGDQTVDISDDAKIVANEMRNQIDALSINIINAGLAPSEVAKEIQENLGTYLTRSYEVFKNEKYKAKEEVIQRAKNLLNKKYLKDANRIAKIKGTEVDFELNRLVNNEIDKLTNRIGADDFIGGGKLGSKSKELGVFKERTKIPIEIRQLMGEFTDPVQNYAETVMKLSALSAKNDFLNKIKDAGIGVYLFTEKTRPEGYNVQIAAPGSDAMNPLNGLYTTPEIAKEFNNLPVELGKLMKIYMKAISMIKWGKTIGSIMTHGKNLFGNLGFVAVNGHTSGAKDAFKAIVSDMKNSSDEEMRKRIDNYIEIGVMNQSTGMNEIRDMFKDADFDKSLAERLSKRPSIKKKPIASVLGRGKRIAKSIGRGFEYAYQAEDDFFKILAYESELRRYSKAEFNKDIKDLTETERAKIDKTVSNIVKDTMPTFSRIPKIVKALRKSPLLGNFISFQAESYRTAFKTMQLAKSEITSKNPEIRAIGARRIVGTTIYLSARIALLSYYGSAFGMGLAGLAGYFGDDDDEKELGKDLRKFLPPWATQSDIIPIKNADGTITYVDMSASDPHGGINKAFNAFFGGDNPIDGAKEAMFSIFKPFLEPEMTAKAMFNLMSGNDNYDRPIWNSEDDWNDMAGNIGSFVWGIAQPGTVTSVNRIIKAEDKLGEIVGGLTGYRPIKVDVGESFGYRVYDYKDRLENAKKLYTNVSRKEEATDEQKEKALEKANLKVEEIYKELMEDYNSAERLGVDSGKLRTELKDKLNLSDKNLKTILSGGYTEVKPKEAEKRRIIFR